ncbi:LysM peptidoglycan-binding domain-containing protein [Steroidobacter sp.]|uniref:LysM peptidoglycan-binding domain-containing protein n=1 Tax=Steroidobacter sp. TaxID=1978227 RepID=UPI001A434541|nr:LysM peptidoglycan-binding domain-containing protein [Steroidobacter sp.]MBL8270771.1 LysM peptidoglycan-binding domain-containing protein [Steroidobacter sp.]
MKLLYRLPILLLLSSLALFTAAIAPASASSSQHFVRPAELEADIAFWRRIYTEVTTEGGLLHDPEELSVVYEALKFPSDIAPKARSARIDEAKKKYSRILDRLASGAEDLNQEELRVQALWPKGTRRSRYEQASEEVRFQLGQADRFREGLVRSGAWHDHIADTFEKMGLPRELAALPHVESSFNTYAYSKVGAAGMWQFMRSTGRRFLRIDAVVDERLDPYRSTQAAARFLEQNYIVLGSWPLALTAYNHGPGGMKRAQEQLGTSDITTIVRKYNSRSFGFASRNFYLAFLAALEIDQNPEKFFPGIRRNAPDSSRVLTMPQPVPASRLATVLDIDQEDLRRLNPALLNTVWKGARHVPRGYEFRVPSHIDLTTVMAKLSTAAPEPADVVLAGTQHRVQSGETLSTIATRYGVSQAQLAEANDLARPYRLRAGQVLALPEKSGRPAAVVAQTPKEVPPPPQVAKQPTPPTGVVGNERYVVRRGDTLGKIAKSHGLTEEQLMELNNIRNRQFIYEGQVLALAASARAKPPVEAEVPVATVAAVVEPPSEAEAVEPVSEREAEEIGPALVPGTQAASSADPSDYSVKDHNIIIVQAAETLGHYAEWLDVRASQLRQLNRISFATPVIVGRKVKLDFSKVSPDQFEARRAEYHRALQEAFFTEFRIQGTSEHVIKRGESVWVLAQQRYNIPIWLLRQYNPDLDLGSLQPGARLVIPLVQATGVTEPSA